MIVKLFEIRDSGTHIDAMAVKVGARNERENYLLGHAGYVEQTPCILLGYLGGHAQPLTYDPYDWRSRTMHDAHLYIDEHWDELKSGDVICTETIRGERETPKESDDVPGYGCRWSHKVEVA